MLATHSGCAEEEQHEPVHVHSAVHEEAVAEQHAEVVEKLAELLVFIVEP